MMFNIQTIAQITSGRALPDHARGTVSGVSTDSRTLLPGDLFVPLRGDNYDGHAFLLQAVRRGAAACLSEEVIAGLAVPVIQVENTLQALGDLAGAARGRMKGPVVAVTGSSGKTTTKEMLAAILSLTGPGLKTEGNFNNLIGLPHTLFRLKPEHRWAVLEMGMSARGEIARLAEIAAPDIGIITNVGPAHLETLHGIDGVARAKGELFVALPAGGTAIINADDDKVTQLPVANGVRRLLFGMEPSADIRAEEVVVSTETVAFRLILPQGPRQVSLHVVGRHNIQNALAAAAAAVVIGVDPDHIVRGLESFRACRGRMEMIPLAQGVTLLEDTYNANPLSVRAALTALDEAGGPGRRFAVLGDMLELGEASAALHCEIGFAAATRADFLLVLGEKAGVTAAGAMRGGMAAERVRIVASHEEAATCLRALLRPGDRVLVKGSRGMRMEKISAALRETDSRRAVGDS
jgi:UDP-N-acetylmuramoyl-tripeptide--D-alanyl-D-alanine ligase